MRSTTVRTYRPRHAFTIIELLVVITIIAILVGLLVPAAMQIKMRVEEARVRTEIGKLDEACQMFKQTYGQFPPSLILLKEAGDYNPLNPVELYSKNYLESIFRGINLRAGHNWNGDRNLNGQEIIDPPGSNGYLLQGDECLVYFLGGIPRRLDPNVPDYVLDGFNSDKANPTVPGAVTVNRPRVSHFDFTRTRLAWIGDERLKNLIAGTDRHSLPAPYPQNWPFPVYLDTFGGPYAYFRGTGGGSPTDNYYGTVSQVPNSYIEFPTNGADNDGDTFRDELNDCPSLLTLFSGFDGGGGYRFIPYWETPLLNPNDVASNNAPWPVVNIGSGTFDWSNIPPGMTRPQRTRFFKADSYQIISAGNDNRFGVGGAAPLPPQDPLNGGVDAFQFDRDNITNFSGGRLGNFRQ